MSFFAQTIKPLLIGLFAILFLTSCDPFTAPSSLMDTYLKRLARVLDVSVETPEDGTVAIWPRVRERRLALPEIEINMLEFLDIYGCDLQVIVGERNAILGKVMQPLNRLRYSLRFIREAEICVNYIDDTSLVNTLKQAGQQKNQQLPTEIWQAGWASEEMAHLFSHSAKPMAVDKPIAASQQLADDFAYLTQTMDALLAGKGDITLERWGQIHQRWQYQDDIGALVKSAKKLTQMLNAGSTMLQRALDKKPICYQLKPNPRAKRLEGMFYKVYIGHVQPYIARVSQHRDALLPFVREFAEKQADIAPIKIKTYWQNYLTEQSGSVWMNFDIALKKHTKHWQEILDQCGLRPEAPKPEKIIKRI